MTTTWGTQSAKRRVRRRHLSERLLKAAGISAIAVALGLLALLVTSLTYLGHSAFTQTMIDVPIYLDPEQIEPADPGAANYRGILKASFLDLLPGASNSADRREANKLLSAGARWGLRDQVVEHPEWIGTTVIFTLPAADVVDQLHKGITPRDVPADERKISDAQIGWYDDLIAAGAISEPINWALILNADSRFPELAGLLGAIIGSFYSLLVCLAISFPVGIAAAVYLEEFAPKNRWTSLIEVNINNLAAVPSVVFGLLGLAVLLNFFGMPRSAPLVGGITLALMTLPTVIIATRASLTAVPPSIREAALGVGASRHQVILHHVLPLALPGILTGTIIGLARALGETAPLLLIGMNAFITSASGGITDPSTALPTQIFIWADSPERGFLARTSAAIIVLLGFLIMMNGIAVYMRKRFEQRW
jgi:phosphate transport system permease protein